MHNFELILISDEHFSKADLPFIKWALGNGLTRFHLRKRNITQDGINELLRHLTDAEQKKTSVHYHHALPMELSKTVGLHFSFDYLKSNTEIIPREAPMVSYSIHQWHEINQLPQKYSYHFISPIFPSISKPGYQNEQLLENGIPTEFINHKNFALGGITAENIPLLKVNGFAGAAVLGAIWHAKDREAMLEKCILACQK